ncbi:MAG: patatin-like phospholipase family protein [Alcaligenes sp.]
MSITLNDAHVVHSGVAADPDSELESSTISLRDYMAAEPAPQAGVFEIALVLAGAISAGAYTAGVCDFLIEALDAWEQAKRDQPGEVPSHSVKIKVVSGASAGAMTAAIAASALRFQFQHGEPQLPDANPFYKAWVKGVDIGHLLNRLDLETSDQPIASLLDSTRLERVTDDALGYRGTPIARPYIEDGVRFIFTQAGLRGIPYYLNFRGHTITGLRMSAHRTYHSFYAPYGNRGRPRPDDEVLNVDDATDPALNHQGWRNLGNAALASGAFPVGLRAREELRRPSDLEWRYAAVAGSYIKLVPAWSQFVSGMAPKPPQGYYAEFVVDGGAMNNEPLDLARTELVGLLGQVESSGGKTQRTLILVDPFPDQPALDFCNRDEKHKGDLESVCFKLASAFKSQAKFSPADLARALHPAEYSRFLLAPSRKPDNPPASWRLPPAPMASASLQGFGGFLDESYRRHDYLLGRRNCQQLLRFHFGLLRENPTFIAGDADANAKYSHEMENRDEYAIIPLIGSLAEPLPRPDWPSKPIDLNEVVDGAYLRAKAVGKALARRRGMSPRMLTRLGFFFFGWKLKQVVRKLIADDLTAKELPFY